MRDYYKQLYASKMDNLEEMDKNTPKLILQGHHHLIPKPDKDTTKKRKLQTNMTDEYRCKKSSTKY